MSPACLAAIFEGDNGGTTSTGVSSTEIRIAFPNVSGAATDSATLVIKALFEYLNARYEFYGRRLVPVFISGGSSTPEATRAQAADIASHQVFAAVTGALEWNYEVNSTTMSTLAHKGVVAIARAGSSYLTDRVVFDPLHPYAWSVYPSAEDVQANLSDFACRTLAGQPARFAGDASMQTRTRRFAILAAGLQVPAARALADGLAACTGLEPLRADWATSAGTPALQTAFERFNAGSNSATTAICLCDSYGQLYAFSAAKAAGFQPEWVLTPSVLGSGYDEGFTQGNRGSGYFAPPMRVGSGPRLLPMQARPWFGALQASGLLNGTGSVSTHLSMAEFLYPELLILAAGVQAAGPALTPRAFAQGLMATQFPNLGVGQAPYYQGSAGFGPGDHSLYDDYNVAWWSDTARAQDVGVSGNATGTWCYVGAGKRFAVGSYPPGDQLLFDSTVPCY